MSVRKRPKKPAVERTLSRDDLAGELDLHPDSIKRHHTRDNPPPHTRRGQKCLYNAGEYQAWMDAEGLTGERGAPGGGDSPDLDAARLRKENALANKYELQVAKETRELIPLAEVKQWIGEHIGRAKNRLIGMAAALAPRLEGQDAAERQQTIEQYIEQIVREIQAATDSVE